MIGRFSAMFWLALAALVAAGPAMAHTGLNIGDGFFAGFAHPFLGLDHLLAMMSVGALAGVAGGDGRKRALWALPLTFMTVMALGGALALDGVALPAVELGIAASVVVFGAMLATHVGLPSTAAMAVVGVFALFHGHAHGAELPEAVSALAYGLGFVLATGLLHLGGVGVAAGFKRLPAWYDLSIRVAGGAVAATGLALLVG